MPYLDPDYERLAVWFTHQYFPKINGKRAISWEEVLKKFNQTKEPSLMKSLREWGFNSLKRMNLL
jgi:hypothetical protein